MLSTWHFFFLIPFMNLVSFCETLEMPVFAPNDFFWKKFWDGKNEEDKWKVFANAVRQAMAEVGGFHVSESTQEDKADYKKMIWGDAALKED